MESQKFLELIEKIRSNGYVESELNLVVDQFFEERYVDRLSDEQTVALAEALKHNTHITKVNLYGNDVGDIGAIALASVTNLEELNLDQCAVEYRGLIALAKSNLKSLIICFDPTDKDPLGEVEMANAFMANKTLVNFDLTYGHFPSYFLNEFIGTNTTITALKLPRYTDDETFKFIGNNKTLKELYIRENQLTDKGAQYLAGNTSIKSLRIDGSHIGDKGAEFLTLLPALKNLAIRESDITARGAKVFIYSHLKEFEISSKPRVLSYEDARHINLAFRDARDDNGRVQHTKKAKVDHPEDHVSYHIEEPLLLGNTEESFVLGGWGSQGE